MEKVKILGFGNEKSYYYLIIKKKGFSYSWLEEFLTLAQESSSTRGVRGVRGIRLHDEDDEFNEKQMTDKHESYSGDNVRIDLFYGKENISVVLISDTFQKEDFLKALEKIADFP
jgi:hypothetical protein